MSQECLLVWNKIQCNCCFFQVSEHMGTPEEDQKGRYYILTVWTE